MLLIGISYFSQHRVVASIPSAKYLMHYYLPREKARKSKKLSDAIPPPPTDLKVAPVSLAPSDSPDPNLLLKEFLKAKTDKKKLLLVAGMNSLFSILKRLRKERKLSGIIVFDNPSNLFDYGINIVDAELISTGMWWKRKGFLEKDIIRTLKECESEKFKLKSLHKIRRKLYSKPEDRPSARIEKEAKNNRPRGFLHSFIKRLDVEIGTNPRRSSLLKTIFGYCVGIEKRSLFKEAFKYLLKKYDVDDLRKDMDKFLNSAKGLALFKVFYLHCKGQPFKVLQAQNESLDLDDWLTMTEHVNPNERHRFYEKP